MKPKTEKRIAATIAKTLAMMCVRNTGIETLHAGQVPITHAGDYSDVRVIDADGREIPWNEVSHLDQDGMRALMMEIVNRLYTFHISIDDPVFQNRIERWTRFSDRWDEPVEDIAFVQKLAEED
ncbi:hypothetical protein [Porphyrobacter sp. LM 6]|jgi:hypothetical protein|uniref:hypothetical protein n=1 Tax=Porphyrobacter sp. LM 6 TaxID=1896196 RepID=UPI000846A3B8|nr:hypothetical protein [Porphyrobacter sp. LM 6]AOL93999.1 hypothetical protein BG023_111061 [Porphyrobacter sp. LM 6]